VRIEFDPQAGGFETTSAQELDTSPVATVKKRFVPSIFTAPRS